MDTSQFLAEVLNDALKHISAQAISVFTFALYHDHESHAVSVCVDTEANSATRVIEMNRYNMKYFMEAVADGDLDAASLWQANIGRNLSLGDFALVNVARRRLGEIVVNTDFYLTMVRSLVAAQARVAALSQSPQRLVLACSGADAEVKYVWALPKT